MAKGLRASVKKSNRTKLRSRVFGPIEDARTERLSAKLLELASQPRAAKSEMDIDAETEPKEAAQASQQAVEDMDLDGGRKVLGSSSSSKKKSTGRIQKRKSKKPANQITFPAHQLKRGPQGKKGKR